MEKLNYNVMLSLKEISLRRLTVILWCQTDILASLEESDVEDKVKDKMSKLELPPLLTEQLKYFAKPIETEMRNWKLFHEIYLDISNGIDVHTLEKVCWTILGTVDFKKTAENLIRLKMLPIIQCYRLACFYCLHDYIPNLWEKLPEFTKEHFYKKDPFYNVTHSLLEFSWPYIIKGEETKLDCMAKDEIGNPITFNQSAFEYSAHKGSKAATEYFFRKLTNVEREATLFETVHSAIMHRWHYDLLEDYPAEKLSETICYLLSLLSLEQQMEICKENTGRVLMCLLDWPWQHIFWDVAEPFWSFLETDHYIILLDNILIKIRSKYPLTKFFQKFLLRGSSSFRKYFVDAECQSPFCLKIFFDLQDSETIKVIFRNVDSSDRKRLVSTRNAFELFYESASRGRWYLVDICLQEAPLTNEDKQELKESYFGFLTEMEDMNIIRDNIWKQFLQKLD